MKILEWLKKNKKYIILAVISITIGIWIASREMLIVKQTQKIDALKFENVRLELANIDLDFKLSRLHLRYDSIKRTNDSLKIVLGKKQKELIALIAKHKKEIDSLTNIPPDTVYKRIGELYPNFDNSPLLYPFSASQIVPIYNTIVSYPRLLEEYSLQGSSLKTCNDLNTGYESGIVNLTSQIGNLQNQIGNYNSQIANYKKEIVITNKKVSRRGFWNRFLSTTTAIAIGVAVLK